jgi:GT2 family glycosyltransferase
MAQHSASVTIVTYNSQRYIRRCLETVLQQTVEPREIVVVDNGSSDETLRILKDFESRIHLICNHRNTGFAAAQNKAIRETTGDWVLTLNPDTELSPAFLQSLLEASQLDPRAGAVCGKLYSLRPGRDSSRILDSTGIFFTPALRHFDRGWNEPDAGQFDRLEYVFGASAAAALYRRTMIEDVAHDGAFFDPDFFVYREDADVAWRAQILGWRCIYTPAALGRHVRRVTPRNRAALPAEINMHSVKNRFLMQIKNLSLPVWRFCWRESLTRDITVIGACLLREHRSLPAFPKLLAGLRQALAWRRQIMARRRASDEDLLRWFQAGPRGIPVMSPATERHDPSVCAAVREER